MLRREGGAQSHHHRIVCQALDGTHIGAVAGDCERDARTRRRAVDQQRTGATHAVFAAEMRAGQQPILAQEVSQVRARRHLGDDGFAVQRQRDAAHASALARARRSRTSCM
jgi:hypothetical protein